MPVGDDADFGPVDQPLQAVAEGSARARLKENLVAPLAEMNGNPLAGHWCHRYGKVTQFKGAPWPGAVWRQIRPMVAQCHEKSIAAGRMNGDVERGRQSAAGCRHTL